MGEERWGPWNGVHEHASDDEESSPQRLRTRSFSDAEDILNGVGYYESFTLPDKKTAPNNGLHHRSRATARNDSNDDDDYDSRQQTGSNSCRSPPKHTTRRKYQSSFRRPNLMKLCLAIGFGSYLFLLIRSSYWLVQSSKGYERPVAGPSSTMSSISQYDWQPQYSDVRRLSQIELDERSSERRDRTRPVKVNTSELNVEWYSLEKTESPSVHEDHLPTSSTTATAKQLCGLHAKNASLTNPQNYPANAAIGPNSRVLITGILNPLGFPLALHLKEQCGVEVIAGIDSMYPNTVLNRLQLQDRIEILTTSIPKLVKPIMLPYVGLDPRQKKDANDKSNASLKSSEFNIMSLNPTHIIHLASFSQEVFSSAMVDPKWKNTHSPYVSEDDQHDPHLYQLRTSMVSMEQILESIATIKSPEDRPQFIYASVHTNLESHHPLHATTKLIDDILADSYRAKYGIQSTAVRLPSDVYGPWGQPGFPIHDIVETMVREWDETKSEVELPGVKPELDLLYVDDAVEAIIAAMQYRSSKPVTVDVASTIKVSPSVLTEKLLSFLPRSLPQGEQALDDTLGLQVKSSTQNDSYNSFHILPQMSIRKGIMKTIAWHLDREAPFGPAVETGDAFLKRFGEDTCEGDDITCHMGRQYLPCASECNTREKCMPSVFDEIRELSYNVTEGCNIVLYTQSLGYNVEDMPLHGEYMDDATIGDDETLICNYAFVPRESDLVTTVTEKVPSSQLAKFGIDLHRSDDPDEARERKLDGLNARLLYRGWILIWVKDAIAPLSTTDKSLLKLSPGQFFHPDVHHALFVEENFSVSPSIDDVSFLVQEMEREELPKRTFKGTKMVVNAKGVSVPKKVKYQVPAEPTRRAAMLFAPLRYPSIDDPGVRKYREGGKKLNVYDAVKFMRYEVGEEWGEKENAQLRRQREFYERVPSIINRNGELRSSYEPWYRYTIRHWVRTRWVVHDLTIEDSRLLRCDWYQEHVQWGNDLDQLSFAHVMAKRELQRRIAHEEPDDHIKTFIEEHPQLKDLIDSYEWHPLETEHNKLYREPLRWNPELPEHIMVPEEPLPEHGDKNKENAAPLYVRIMSERIMAGARKAWNKKAKAKKKDLEKGKNKNHGKH